MGLRSKKAKAAASQHQGPATVILTGSTGNLGCYILHSLLQNPQVEKVHCLVRSQDSETRQKAGLKARGLPLWQADAVQFHVVDLEQAGELGLPQTTRDDLYQNATHIIHCAWPVDWNRNFSSFKPALTGVSNIITFTLACAQKPVLFFISSIAAVGNWGAIPGARLHVPEEEVEDWKTARFGYGQSKLVSEKLIADAVRSSGLRASICRVSQLGGPVLHGDCGCWPEQEWFPSMLKSSKHMGMIPATLGPMNDIDWVPVDHAGQAITEMVFHDPPELLRPVVYHLSNPTKIAWDQLLASVQKCLPDVNGVPLESWVKELEERGKVDSVKDSPAFKLMPVFEDLADRAVHLPKARAAILDVSQSCRASPTLRGLAAVSDDWIRLWMQQLAL